MVLEETIRETLIEECYERNESAMLDCAYALIGNRTDADDAVHDAFVKVLESDARFSCASQATAYLMRAVKTCSLDMLRAKARMDRMLAYEGKSQIEIYGICPVCGYRMDEHGSGDRCSRDSRGKIHCITQEENAFVS